jgi:tRNAThr (cytosine32-N3)-methyltransferase
MTSEDVSLPPPSDSSTPIELTPTATPPPPAAENGRDPVIQRSAVFGTRYLTDPTKVFDYNSWDQVTPDPDHLALAIEKIAFQQQHKLSPKDRKRFLERPAYFWDMFYRNNRENFFKNRKWLLREFPALKACCLADAGDKVVFEAGCGVGNAMFPVLEGNENPRLKVHGRDYSPRAIEVLLADPQFDPEVCTAGVWDITSETLPEGIAEGSVDVITLLFVLSALVFLLQNRGV